MGKFTSPWLDVGQSRYEVIGFNSLTAGVFWFDISFQAAALLVEEVAFH